MKQVTLRKQLKDPVFRKWFAIPPKEAAPSHTPPWWVYVQEEKGGPWRRAEFASWVEGYRFVAKNINKHHDMALTHKRQEYKPPVIRDESGKRKFHVPEAPGHHWCTLCRRMTLFRYFRTHHAFVKGKNGIQPVLNGGDRRCSICGIRLVYIKRWT